jgi:hypothetical protein
LYKSTIVKRPFVIIASPSNTSLVICGDFASDNVTCNSGGKIKVLSSFYGRMSYNICRLELMKTDNCFLDGSAIVASL